MRIILICVAIFCKLGCERKRFLHIVCIFFCAAQPGNDKLQIEIVRI